MEKHHLWKCIATKLVPRFMLTATSQLWDQVKVKTKTKWLSINNIDTRSRHTAHANTPTMPHHQHLSKSLNRNASPWSQAHHTMMTYTVFIASFIIVSPSWVCKVEAFLYFISISLLSINDDSYSCTSYALIHLPHNSLDSTLEMLPALSKEALALALSSFALLLLTARDAASICLLVCKLILLE